MSTKNLAPGARLTAVKLRNEKNEELGKVVEWMMDVEEGKVIYVIASLSKEDRYYAIPWQLMKADLKSGGYIIDFEKVRSAGVTLSHIDVNTLVEDKKFLPQMLERYGLTSTQAATPDGNASQGERKPSAGEETRQAATRPAEDESDVPTTSPPY